MAGPPNMVVIDGMQATGGDGGMIPEGESSQVFAENVAGFIQNMVPHPDGGLESVRGPCPLIHDLGAGYPLIGTPHGLFSARLRERTTLLMHAGSTMWTFEGSDPAAPWQATVDPAGAAVQALADDDRPRTPDQFVQFSDYVIWTNGVDRARIISSGDITFPLGFSETPSAPEVDGPVSPGETDKARYFVNSKGFSWKGEIGTEGDVLSSGSGKLLTSAHRYCVQLEDHFGNLSPISPASNSFNVWSIRSQPYSLDNNDVVTARLTTAEIDDLLRMASVFISGGRPRHAKAARVGRTADIRRNPRDFKLLRRIPGRGNTVFPDYISDGRLGAPMVEKAPVPIFRYMVRHGARLIIANMVSDPGMVRRSDIGYPGTFSEREWSTPAPDASEVSGLISHGGLLIAGTTTSLVDMSGDKFHRPETLTKMVGIGAHRSVQGLSDGSVVWLGVNGHFYRMDTNGGLQLADISDGIRTLVTQGLNLSRLQQAASVVHPVTGQYLCAVPSAGSTVNDIILAYSPRGWSRFDYGCAIHDLCVLDDAMPDVYAAATVGAFDMVLNLSGETRDFDPPLRTAVYRSRWLRLHPFGYGRFNVRTMWIGCIDSYAGNIDVIFRRDWSSKVEHVQQYRSVGRPFGAVAAGLTGAGDDQGAPFAAGDVRIGTDVVRDRRLFWRKIPVGIDDCATFSFEIQATYPEAFRLAAFIFDATATTQAPQERWPDATAV